MDRWVTVKQIFAEATERSPSDRRAFLDARCEGDDAMMAEVLGLLEAHESAAEFLAPPTRHDDGIDDRRPGDSIGAYTIVERLGAGGMGAVYLCTRGEGEQEERVAIKVVKRGMDTEQVLSRFRTEQRTLANLAHPNIASFLDSGVSKDGLPYIVMEYFSGERIDRYCDAHTLSVHERVELFQQICSAVQHAHRNLVVHRDLKPANILISDDGEPRLLDFGLAKIVSDEGGEAPLTITAPSRRFLTPEYASPEQAMGRPVTTATDVYSLGVMLYELLTGRRPLALRGRSASEIERALEREDPPLPSAAVSPGARMRRLAPAGDEQERLIEIAADRGTTPERLKRTLSGDLDWIVMRALQKDPSRRYTSVEQFNEDLRRFCEGLPVLARRDTLVYRTQKFLRRHRTMTIATAAIVLVVLIGSITTIWQAGVAAQERRLANDAQMRAERINTYTAQVLSLADPAVMGSRDRFREFLERASDQLSAELSDEPAARAQVHEEFGRVYYTHGDYSEALRHLRTALALRRSLKPRNDQTVIALLHLLGTVMTEAGQLSEAEETLQQAMDQLDQLEHDDELRRAGILENMIDLRRAQRDLIRAEALAGELLAIYEHAMADQPAFIIARRTLLAEILSEGAEHEAALALYEECIADLKALEPVDPVTMCVALNGYAKALAEAGRLDDSRRTYKESITRLRMADEIDSRALADALQGYAASLTRTGSQDDARALLEEAAEIKRNLLGSAHPDVRRIESQIQTMEGR